MGRATTRPLTTEEAKARLRAAAEQASLSTWVQRHPLHALGVALVGGFVAGRLRAPVVGSLLLAQKLVAPVLLGMARRK
jgi:hypothetical protein